jgi:alkaline phosphatase D
MFPDNLYNNYESNITLVNFMSQIIPKSLILTSLLIQSSLILSNVENETYVIGFGSCITEKREQPIWKAINDEGVDEFFFMGDNVYGDSEDGLLNDMKASYEKQKQMFPKWIFSKKLNAIWDDHDYGKNDGGKEYPLKTQAQELFLKFWDVDKEDPRHTRKGIYFSEEKEILGTRVNLIALDTRYHRSPLGQESKPYSAVNDKTKTMLGEEQWQWLEKVLKKESDMIIIVSSIQVMATNHGFEKWHNFPHERLKLLNLLESQKKPIIILSGDRHRAGYYKNDSLIEITSSSMNKPPARTITAIWDTFFKESDELLVGEMYSKENYGTIVFNKESKVSIYLKDLNGDEIFSVQL